MEPRPMTVTAGDWLRLNASRFPNRVCFDDQGEGVVRTFAETNERVNRLANALTARGVERFDRLAILAVDSHRYMETLLASMKLGTTYVPLNYRLAAFEIQNLVVASDAEWIFVSERYVELAKGLVTSSGRPLRVVTFGDGDAAVRFEDLIEEGSSDEPNVPVDDEDILGLAFTSGTTGLPKGVLQSQRMIKRAVMTMMLDFDVRDEERRYSAAPMFHISGMALILLGVARGFPNVLYHQFEPDRVLDWLHEGRLTGCFLVPTMITSLVEHPRAAQGNYDALHGILYGAAPMSPTLLRRAMDIFKCDFIQAFGAGTEACLQTVLSAADHRRAASGAEHLLGSIGRPALGVELRLCDDHLNDVPRGEVGEIVTRSESVMSGYLRNPEATADTLVDGWFRAGDMAYMDDDGFLYLAGRKKDMIIRGGENIYPIEIETVLAEHPAVLEAAVIGVPDDHWGEIVRAYVSVRRGMEAPTDDGLRAHCRRKLAGYKVPAEFVVVDELPRNASGKILKRELRAS